MTAGYKKISKINITWPCYVSGNFANVQKNHRNTSIKPCRFDTGQYFDGEGLASLEL